VKKHWRKIVLLLGLAIAGVTACLAWLGFLPIARPTNEEDFLAEQLRRVQYAGPLRDEHELAIADSLPDDPTTDDLRVAYCRHLQSIWADHATRLLQNYPELASPMLPPEDIGAREAYERACSLAGEVEKHFPYEYDQTFPQEHAAEFLEASASLIDMIKAARPAGGKVLLGFDPVREENVILPDRALGPARIGVQRCGVLIATGQVHGALDELRALADFACSAEWSPCWIGEIVRLVFHSVVYLKGVLPVAEKGVAPVDWLLELGDLARLRQPDPIVTNALEFSLRLLGHVHFRTREWAVDELEVWRLTTKKAFEEQGATSLGDWVEQNSSKYGELGWPAVAEQLRHLRNHPVDFTDAEAAGTFFTASYASPAESLWDNANSLAQIAASGLEAEALTLAVRLHALKAQHPDGWTAEASSMSAQHSMLKIAVRDDSVEIRPNLDHPTVRYGRASMDLYATVR
jgi:hypothetical protein